jgi:hypothetical protein
VPCTHTRTKQSIILETTPHNPTTMQTKPASLLEQPQQAQQLQEQQKIELPSSKPQLHSHKHHNTYNGSRHLPLAVSVRRSPRLQRLDGDNKCSHHHRQHTQQPHHRLYEVTLYYAHNRACTLYRSWDDFVRLDPGLQASLTVGSGVLSNGINSIASRERTRMTGKRVDVRLIEGALRVALAKAPGSCSVEYFLRRKMGDCGL